MQREKYYGIVEGFFSEPLSYWTHRERLATLAFITESCPHFNTYFYTPKNDPWVEQRPFDRYPKKKREELRATVALCKKKNLVFVYGFNPAFALETVERDFEAYVASIEKKILQLHAIGVRNFCILYDEIPFALNFDEAKIRSAHDARVGTIHARIMNALRRRLEKKVDALWFCPPDYSFRRTTPYLTALFSHMDPAIATLWTGDGIFTKTISQELVRQGKAVAGKKRNLVYWDNYPVNDCPHPLGTFHVGAFNAPSPAAHRDLAGILINPMREAGANAIAYLTLEAYLENPRGFDRNRAMDAAFRTLFGASGPAYARLYATFTDKNIADDVPRGYYHTLLKVTDETEARHVIDALNHDLEDLTPPHNPSARDFVRTTASVITRAKSTAKILSAMLANKPWEKQFLAADHFPVTLNKKYLTRQYAVLTTRVAYINALGASRSPVAQALERQLKTLRDLYLKYKNKNRLGITAADEKKLLRTLEVLIPLERKLFVQQIKGLSVLEKIRAFIRRSQINGY